MPCPTSIHKCQIHWLPRPIKELLLQYTVVGKNSIIAILRLLWTSSFVMMTSSTKWRMANVYGYLIGLMYLMFGPFWVALIWYTKRHFYFKMRASSSKIVYLCHLAICSRCSTYLRHPSLITMAHPIYKIVLQLGTTSLFGKMQMS
jgi:hypothetical protein